jgi:Zn-dependent M28 family amino/carboxypeptidase
MNAFRLLRSAAIATAIAAFVAIGAIDLTPVATQPGTVAAGRNAPQIDQARLLDDVRALASPDFAGRRTGTDGSRKAQAFLQARFEALGLKPFGASYAQPFEFTHAGIKQSAVNYIAYIPGTAKPEGFMVISAHYDHLGVKDATLYPGADDNASGVGAMLAVAAWFKAHPPRHSIVIAAFDAEELGLRGAKAFLAALPFPKQQLAMNLNFDMVSHNDSNEIFVAGTSYTPAFKPLIEQVARRSTVSLKLGHDRPRLLLGLEDWTNSSDHGPFHEAGIPFLYFGVEDHPDYHAPSDTFERINQPFYINVASLLVDVAATLDANLDASSDCVSAARTSSVRPAACVPD